MQPALLASKDQLVRTVLFFYENSFTNEGIVLTNNGYDWGVKNSSDSKALSGYRIITIGNTDIVYLTLDIGYPEKITNSSIAICQLPDSIALPGENAFVGVPGMRFTIVNNVVRVIRENGNLNANTRMRLRTVYLINHG